MNIKYIKVKTNYLKGILSSYASRPLNVGNVSLEQLRKTLSLSGEQAIFLHVGLSALKKALGPLAQKELIDIFRSQNISILVPGFTPSFRQSGIYHKQFSQPEYGTFSKLFLPEANDRTDDAIHSILIKGIYSFSGCNHQKSFADDSCFGKIDRDNLYYVNIGTRDLVCTQLHFIEHHYTVPYNEIMNHEGILYDNESNYRHITQANYRHNMRVTWNRNKIRKLLIKEGVMKEHQINGLCIRLFRAGDLKTVLGKQIIVNPYYLVT